MANQIVERTTLGESWTGQFPVKNKKGERFAVVATLTPFYDEDGTLIGVISVSSDSQLFIGTRIPLKEPRQSELDLSLSRLKSSATTKLGLDPQQPLQVAIASKISNLVSPIVFLGFRFC